MKTSEQPAIITYLETARTPSSPVKIDIILAERIQAFRRAKNLVQNNQAS